MLGASGVLGMTLGSIIGGRVVKLGRRAAFLIACMVGIVGVSITMIERIPFILLGRLIYGFSCGLISICVPRFIEETVPNQLNPIFSPIFCCS